MIRSLYYSSQRKIETGLALGDYQHALKDENGLLWVDFQGTPPESDEPILREVFGFHPLAIDDALQESHIPKLDDWADYLYIVLHSVTFNGELGQEEVGTLELDIFLGNNYLVTHHDQPISSIDRLWDSGLRDVRRLESGPDYLLYWLIDELVASYMPVIEEIDNAIDLAEDKVFADPTPDTLERILALKRSALHLRRIIGPQREVLNKLARDDYRVIDVAARIYFRDVYDHLVRMQDITESIRDMVSSTLETYLSVINNRMNDIMKTLTVITTIFMPIAFLTSFFGMNFFQPVVPALDAWTRMPAFVITMVLMILSPIGMLVWMRRRGWM